MFVLQKIVGAFLDFPGIIVALFVIAGVGARLRQKPARGYFLSALFLYLFSVGWVIGLFPQLTPSTTSSPPQAIVVLGGGIVRDPVTLKPSLNPYSLSRVYRTFCLYQETHLPIIASGGKIYEGQEYTDAEIAKEILRSWGVPEKDILLETRSRTTWENAHYTGEILRKHGMQNFYLVTSGVHLWRAFLAFKRWYPEGNPVPVSAHPLVNLGTTSSWEKFLPKQEVLCAWGEMWHEFVGYLLYLLYPAPPLG
ncbi:MAG: YdcF family protein [Candidatus Caldatribacteriaceae bacterium]